LTLKVLFAAAEALPFSKTGGLADVAQALPAAIAALGADVRLVTPAYRGARDRLAEGVLRCELAVRGQRFALWEGRGSHPNLRVWLLDHAPLFAREGGPYTDASGRDHPDNAWRFGCFCEAVARLALDEGGQAWIPDVVHLNDWHTGLAAVWLARSPARPRTVFTIHNLAYQGRFGRNEYQALGLPAELWHPGALELYDGFSFLKAGLVFSDALTTVSPTYAREIRSPEFGEGMDGVIRSRAHVLQGITNGIDLEAWDPATDPFLVERYDLESLAEGKRANKRAVQEAFGLDVADGRPLVGAIGRLAHQKGSDLLLHADPWLDHNGAQLALLGTGDPALEHALREWAQRRPRQVAVHIGYEERLAHLIEAGADLFLMPSRYEPCGLNQMYSQRYGTVPVVRRTGGLVDTVRDATCQALATGSATGVIFDRADANGIVYGLRRAFTLMKQPEIWRAMQRAGMRSDFSWSRAACSYLALYEGLVEAASMLRGRDGPAN
jgi:starch synthase